MLLDLFDPEALDQHARLRLRRLRTVELAGESDWRWMGPQGWQELAERLRNFRGIVKVPVPTGLQANLREY